MKFSITQSELQNALSIVSKGVSTRSTLPILSGILLDAQNEQITFQTTDLKLSIQYCCNALIEEEGKVVIPGKLFSDIVKNLPDMAVHIETKEECVLITCDNSSFTLKTLNHEDFPGFPQVDTTQKIEIPFTQFQSMVKRVVKVVSKDESRAVLTGVLVELENNQLKMVATDSYRLAVSENTFESVSNESFQAVIDGIFLNEIASLPSSEENVSIALAENQIVVKYVDTTFVNRRIEGNFPNYKQLLPDNFSARAKVNLSHLTAAVKRTSSLIASDAPIKIDIDSQAQILRLSTTTQDVGSAQETIPCEIEGQSTEIAFNCSFVLAGLSYIDTEEVFLEAQSSLKPGIFRAQEPEKYLYLIMPVRIS